jgi:hypothetical protein
MRYVHSNGRSVVLLRYVLLLMLAGVNSAAGAGTWTDAGSTFSADPSASAIHDVPPMCDPAPPCIEPPPGTPPVTGYIAGLLGNSFGRIAYAECDDHFPLHNCHWWGTASSWTVVDGVGTSTISIRAQAHADTSNRCECPGWGPITGTVTNDTRIAIQIDGVPLGQPVTVYYSWYALLNRWTDFEAAADDPAYVQGLNGLPAVTFEITHNGVLQLAPPGTGVGGAAATPNATLFLPGNPSDSTGSFSAVGGDVIIIDFEAEVGATIALPPQLPGNQFDQSNASFYGEITLRIDAPLPAIANPGVPGNAMSEFSVDIGSDREMSDPSIDGDEVFDPGDTYPWYGAALPAGGADGVRDDALALTVDYWPQAPDGPLAVTGAATCSVPFASFDPLISHDRFDLDGTDAIDISLRDIIPPGPVDQPIPIMSSACIYADPYLLVSFDDDWAAHYAWDACGVPAGSTSESGATHGTGSGNDEVVMLTTAPIWPPAGGVPSVLLGGVAPLLSELALHPSLDPNPDPPVTGQDFDDDVDALDVHVGVNAGDCNVWYISADHEATGVYQFNPLDPGDIYEVLPLGGLTKVIDDVIHLGLPDDTDIDAFEFVWLRVCDPDEPTMCGDVLAVLFSVDEDDFLSPGDESGGLDPSMVYASLLDGSHFAYLSSGLRDDVDAIAASPLPFVPVGPQVLVNDDCVNAISIGTGITAFTNQGASTDGPIEPCGFQGDVAGNSDADIWFTHVAPCDGTATFTFDQPQFDLLYAVYHQVCPLQGGALLACDQVAAGATHSVTLAVVAGESYVLRIGGQSGAQGSGTLDIDCQPSLPCPWDFDNSGDVGTSDFFALLQNWGLCDPQPAPCPWDFDNSGDVGTSDFFTLLQNWGPCP